MRVIMRWKRQIIAGTGVGFASNGICVNVRYRGHQDDYEGLTNEPWIILL